jgi:hypothetical protein
MTVKELLGLSNNQIFEYINAHKFEATLGLDIKIVAGIDRLAYYGKLLKKSNVILVSSQRRLILDRFDSTSHIYMEVCFVLTGKIAITVNRYEYKTGKLIDSKGIIQ